MEEHFLRPKSFGAVLDQTFRISKNNFSTFLLIMLIVVGPIILLDALISLLAGNSFFREFAGGASFLEQLTNTMDASIYAPTTLAEDLGEVFVFIATIVFYPIALVAVIYSVEALKNQEEFTAGAVIKRAFSRFWPILASSLLLFVIIFGMFLILTILVPAITAIGVILNPFAGIAIFIVLFLAAASVVAYFSTRWGLYLPAVAFERVAPGLGRSWNLTRRNFWRTFGLFVVIYAITIVIGVVFDMLFLVLLGNSVLYSILINIITMITMMFFSVGYALVYFDLKLRNDGDDLMEMIENYESPKE